MKNKIRLWVLAPIVLSFVLCGPPPAPKEYIHSAAGFKFTAAAGWAKTDEDNDLMEFRNGNNRLVEVGGFDLGVTPDEMSQLTEEEFATTLEGMATEGLAGYCEEAKIKNYVVVEQGPATFTGLPGYKIRAKGYSDEVSASVVVDIVMGIQKSKGRAYMFSSQIVESEYEDTSAEISTMIASFQLL